MKTELLREIRAIADCIIVNALLNPNDRPKLYRVRWEEYEVVFRIGDRFFGSGHIHASLERIFHGNSIFLSSGMNDWLPKNLGKHDIIRVLCGGIRRLIVSAQQLNRQIMYGGHS